MINVLLFMSQYINNKHIYDTVITMATSAGTGMNSGWQW